MLAKTRQSTILNLIKENQWVSIKNLSELLDVSISTIQRDLYKLEQNGKIKRERGGAISVALAKKLTVEDEIPVSDNENTNAEQKQMICIEAAKVIEDGDIVFVDSGTTTTFLAPYLVNKSVTIVTNSHYFVRKISNYDLDIIMLGGKYYKKYDMNWGSITLNELDNFSFDRCFITANGLNLSSGDFCNVEIDNGYLKEKVMKRSKKSYILLDSSKFNVTTKYCFANIDDFDSVFVDNIDACENKWENIIVCDRREDEEKK